MSSISLNCPKGLYLNADNAATVDISTSGAGQVTVNGIVPVGATGPGGDQFAEVFIENPVGDKSRATLITQAANTSDVEIKTAGTGKIELKNNSTDASLALTTTDIEAGKDVKPTATFTNMYPIVNSAGTTVLTSFSPEVKLFRDFMMYHSAWRTEIQIPPANQANSQNTFVLLSGLSNCTQYYAGKKAANAANGQPVIVPFRELAFTGGFLSFEFFDSGSTADAAPPVPRPPTTGGGFPAAATTGDPGTGGTAGYSFLKIVTQFIMPHQPQAFTTVSAHSETPPQTIVYNNRLSPAPTNTNVNVQWAVRPVANGSFEYTLNMPATPTYTNTNYAWCYITYQPQMDLRQFD